MLQEKQYQPSKTEKAAAYGVAGLMDFAIMPVGGMKTAVVATAASAGVDVVFSNNGSQESVDTMASKSLLATAICSQKPGRRLWTLMKVLSLLVLTMV